jgi:hypothetical protein
MVDPVFLAGIPDRVKRRDRAADTCHPKVQKYTDGRCSVGHNRSNDIVEADLHA